MATEIRVPTLGESVSEATIGTWFKKVGDTVKADEPLVELETDKVTVEVPSPVSGVLTEIVAQNGGRLVLNGDLNAFFGFDPAPGVPKQAAAANALTASLAGRQLQWPAPAPACCWFAPDQ